jgi:carbonic anhydrase
MSANAESTLSADEALLQLQAGNERFLAGTARFPTVQKEILADLAKGQHP